MSRFGCQHELVQIESPGDVPVYKCRLCGAVMRSRKATRATRLLQSWFFGISCLGISCVLFFSVVLPGLTSGEVPAAFKSGSTMLLHKDKFPSAYWGNMLFYLGFLIVVLAISLWHFRCVWRERKATQTIASKN